MNHGSWVSILGSWIVGRDWVVSVALNRGCFGGGCWLVSSVVGVGYLGRVVGVALVVGLWFNNGWCINGSSGWFGGGWLHFAFCCVWVVSFCWVSVVDLLRFAF